MALYGPLLISAGGGVVDHDRQADRQKEATVIIGLGGTGGNAVRNIKKEVFRQLQPDDLGASVPEYSNIRFLIIDSDPTNYKDNSNEPADIDYRRELFDISYDGIAYDFSRENWPRLANNKAMNWLNFEQLDPKTAKAGAGSVRQIGRYLLVRVVSELYHKIVAEIARARAATGINKINIHICSGLSGGTGGGIFLDICYLVRKAIMELGIPDAQICGYFFLPDVDMTIREIAHDPIIQTRLKTNGYAAMQELDYCMNYDKNLDSFKMFYGNGFTVDDSRKPVDLCYLVSATDCENRTNGYKYAIDVVTEHVINFLSCEALPMGVNNQDNVTLEEVVAMVKHQNAVICSTSGASHDYNMLGASVAEMPIIEIATYLGVKVFENLETIYDRVPNRGERDDLQTQLRLRYEDLVQELLRDCILEIPYNQKYNGSLLAERGVGFFVTICNQIYEQNVGIMDRNAHVMAEDSIDYRTNAKNADTSLIGRLFKALYEKYVYNICFGPFYAKRMLYGPNNENIYNAVLGLIEQNRERLRMEEIQDERFREELEYEKERAGKANVFNRNKCAENLKATLNNYCIHICRMNAYMNLEKVLVSFKAQIQELDQRHFCVLTHVMETLRETFYVNGKEYLFGVPADPNFKWMILSNTDIAAQLDVDTQHMNEEAIFTDLMLAMSDRVEDWIDQDEHKVCRLISEFILSEFRGLTMRTMTDYLNIKYNTFTTQALSSVIDTNIMQGELGYRATPLFWQSPEYNEMNGSLSILSIPYNSDAIDLATGTLRNTQRVIVRKAHFTDKISLMRCVSGIPMYAYQGLRDLQRAYELDGSSGRHLYEGDINWNKLLPSPIPLSRAYGDNERLARKKEEITNIWEKAKEANIVESGIEGRWHINLLQDLDMDAMETELKTVSRENTTALIAFASKLREALVTKKTVDIQVRGIVQEGFMEQVCLDIFAQSPKMVEMVVAEMNLRDRLADLENRLF